MTEDVKRHVPEKVLEQIYIGLCESYERLDNGKMNLKACINYLEMEHGFRPPPGYLGPFKEAE